jgi:hypothetical protein
MRIQALLTATAMNLKKLGAAIMLLFRLIITRNATRPVAAHT